VQHPILKVPLEGWELVVQCLQKGPEAYASPRQTIREDVGRSGYVCTIGIRIHEMIPKAICDAVQQELRVMIVSESPMPGFRPIHHEERTGR
jgi:hypothetical protein